MGPPPANGPYRSDELLRAVTAISPECIKVVGRDGRLLQMNPAGLAMIEADSWESSVYAMGNRLFGSLTLSA